MFMSSSSCLSKTFYNILTSSIVVLLPLKQSSSSNVSSLLLTMSGEIGKRGTTCTAGVDGTLLGTIDSGFSIFIFLVYMNRDFR